MSYRTVLPQFFTGIEMSDRWVVACVDELLRRDDLPNGSSFAVTTDTEAGNKVLWLSKASMDYLDLIGMLEDVKDIPKT